MTFLEWWNSKGRWMADKTDVGAFAYAAGHEEGVAAGCADALREAAGMAASWHDSADCDPCDCLKAVSANILSLIDQPQEEVCECNADPSHRIGFKFCPYCGKPIKVKS